MTTVTSADTEVLKRVDALRNVKASIKGLSIEPLWEQLPPEKLNLEGIDWVIVGGESGSGLNRTETVRGRVGGSITRTLPQSRGGVFSETTWP